MSLLVSDLELRTSGPAGEYQGDCMGVYQFYSEDESQGRVYKQRHDNGGTQYYLHRSVYHTNIHEYIYKYNTASSLAIFKSSMKSKYSLKFTLVTAKHPRRHPPWTLLMELFFMVGIFGVFYAPMTKCVHLR